MLCGLIFEVRSLPQVKELFVVEVVKAHRNLWGWRTFAETETVGNKLPQDALNIKGLNASCFRGLSLYALSCLQHCISF